MDLNGSKWIEIWLAVEPTPLKNMSSSVGMMTFPTEWKNKIHVPNHQSVIYGYLPRTSIDTLISARGMKRSF